MAETGIRLINGGHNTCSTDFTSCNPGSISATRARASSTVLFIFQLPATNGVRMKGLPVKVFSKFGQLYNEGQARALPFGKLTKSAVHGMITLLRLVRRSRSCLQDRGKSALHRARRRGNPGVR